MLIRPKEKIRYLNGLIAKEMFRRRLLPLIFIALIAVFCWLLAGVVRAASWQQTTLDSWYGGGYLEQVGLDGESWPEAGSLTLGVVSYPMKAAEACEGDFKITVWTAGTPHNSQTETLSLTTSPTWYDFTFTDTINIADITGISFGVPVPNTTAHPCYHNEGAGHWHSLWGYTSTDAFDGYKYPYSGGGDCSFIVNSFGGDIDNPVVSVYDPPDETSASVAVWNAPYSFRATSDLNADEYPEIQVFFKWQISQNSQVVYTSPDLPLLPSNTYYNDNYAVIWPSSYVFSEGEYQIQSKAMAFLHDWGDWSEAVTITVEGGETGGSSGWGGGGGTSWTTDGKDIDISDVFRLGASTADDVCAEAPSWDWHDGIGWEWNLANLLSTFFDNLLYSLKSFFWADCQTVQPILDLRNSLLNHAPFRQAIGFVGTLVDAIQNEPAPEDKVLKIEGPHFVEGVDSGDVTLFDPDEVYDKFGGEDFWSVVRLAFEAGTSLALGFYFWHKVKKLSET